MKTRVVKRRRIIVESLSEDTQRSEKKNLDSFPLERPYVCSIIQFGLVW